MSHRNAAGRAVWTRFDHGKAAASERLTDLFGVGIELQAEGVRPGPPGTFIDAWPRRQPAAQPVLVVPPPVRPRLRPAGRWIDIEREHTGFRRPAAEQAALAAAQGRGSRSPCP